jgi:hypothetical protein
MMTTPPADQDPAIAEAIASFLTAGDHDPQFCPWPGDVLARGQRGRRDLLEALVTEVRRRAPAPEIHTDFARMDVPALTRRRVEPMIRGLFPHGDQAAVRALVERSVVFLLPGTVAEVLRGQRWMKTAWDLANLCLMSVGAELLAEDAPRIVGLSEETTCYVSMDYFTDADPFADFVVHEAAHVFHNCKRHTVGLPESRGRQ